MLNRSETLNENGSQIELITKKENNMEMNIHNVTSVKTKTKKIKVEGFIRTREVKVKTLVIEYESMDKNAERSIQTAELTLFMKVD
jgi:hypothetical protein